MGKTPALDRNEERTWGAALARLLRVAEETVYILIGVLLVIAAGGLLISAGARFVGSATTDAHQATLGLISLVLLTRFQVES